MKKTCFVVHNRFFQFRVGDNKTLQEKSNLPFFSNQLKIFFRIYIVKVLVPNFKGNSSFGDFNEKLVFVSENYSVLYTLVVKGVYYDVKLYKNKLYKVDYVIHFRSDVHGGISSGANGGVDRLQRRG